QIGRAEEQLALDVDDRDLRMDALGGIGKLGETALLRDGILGQGGGAGLLQEESEGDADADINGGIELEQQAGGEGDEENHGIGARGVAGDPDLGPVDHLHAHADEGGGEGGGGDEVEHRGGEEQDEQHDHAAEHGGQLGDGAALEIDRGAGEGGG